MNWTSSCTPEAGAKNGLHSWGCLMSIKDIQHLFSLSGGICMRELIPSIINILQHIHINGGVQNDMTLKSIKQSVFV